MTSDLRLAWLLTRGSGLREWWRSGLTAVGAGLATGFALAAVAIASLEGQYTVGFGNGLLDQPGERSGVVLALALLLIPVLGFLGQCSRVGAVHRDRRLAALRLAGAAPAQVRRIAALEAGLACLAGSAAASLASALVVLEVWHRPPVTVWAGFALATVAVPVLGALVSALALRRVIASPLGRVRRVHTTPRPGRVFLGAAAVLTVLLLTGLASNGSGPLGSAQAPPTVFFAVLLTGSGAVWLCGASARLMGTFLAARTGRPAVLIAAERLRDDPWALARTHAAVLLVTIVGTGFVGVRQALLDTLDSPQQLAASRSFYTTGLDLTAAAIAVALLITLSALAVGTAESLATRRRGLAAQAAAGVPQAVLGRALLLETALPLAPALLPAGVGGMVIGTGYAGLAGSGSLPWAALLVPVGMYSACLLAAAASLPLLRRSVRPGELRYA
ncbi:FtsX-like permease family protein [Streptomyces sp. NPDC052023]|uniref:FtsX-like permease family protein n=1 Tax=Streptomyces sp. NPDC052023 TaxID=3365681 RepID=UPI0037CE3C31